MIDPKNTVVMYGNVSQTIWKRLRNHDNIRAITQEDYELRLDRISTESQQEDAQQFVDSVKSLYVIRPRQTGFSAVAELTAQAISAPDKTAVLVERVDTDYTPVEKTDLDLLEGKIAQVGGTVLKDLNEAETWASGIRAQDSSDERID